MPKRDAAPLGAPCWIELFTTDPDAAQAFYGQLFGWTSEVGGPEFGGYISFFKDGLRVAGGMRNDGSAGTPDMWSIYLATADVDATAAAATAHGATIVAPPMQVGEMGSMAVMLDPGGALVGAWQAGEHKGFQLLAEDGAPGWFELHTRDYAKVIAFYQQVFGWDTHEVGDSDDFRYTTLGEGDDQQAGIMDATSFLPDGAPSTWSVYIAVDDADATIARVIELGGSVVQPAEDTPYGRLATVADTTGTVFKLVAGGS